MEFNVAEKKPIRVFLQLPMSGTVEEIANPYGVQDYTGEMFAQEIVDEISASFYLEHRFIPGTANAKFNEPYVVLYSYIGNFIFVGEDSGELMFDDSGDEDEDEDEDGKEEDNFPPTTVVANDDYDAEAERAAIMEEDAGGCMETDSVAPCININLSGLDKLIRSEFGLPEGSESLR